MPPLMAHDVISSDEPTAFGSVTKRVYFSSTWYFMHICVRARAASDCEITRSHRDNYISIENNVAYLEDTIFRVRDTCSLNVKSRREFFVRFSLYIVYLYLNIESHLDS